MFRFSVVSGVVIASIIPTAASSQDVLGSLIKAITKPVSAAGKSQSAPSAIVSATPQQVAATAALLKPKFDDPRIGQDFAAARPLLEKMMNIAACGTNDTAWHALNREAVLPKTYQRFPDRVARGYDQYHDASQCYDLVRITDVEKPAGNALSFKAHFVSPSSESASALKFETQRSPEGQWLFRSVSK